MKTKNKWVDATIQIYNINDHLYFYNTTQRLDSLVVKPFQYNKSIQYVSAEIAKEIKFRNKKVTKAISTEISLLLPNVRNSLPRRIYYCH